MRLNPFISAVVSTALLVTSVDATACSVFMADSAGHLIVGRNLDWPASTGYIVVNKRNLAKEALIRPGPEITPAKWVSRYGSVSFDQVGFALPMGGINEKGLVVEALFLGPTTYPPTNSSTPKQQVNELQWAQYQLDSYGSVAEVLNHIGDLQIVMAQEPLHYFICDPSGTCASIDILLGKYEVHTGDSMPVRALTNSTYAASLKFSTDYMQSKQCARVSRDYASVDRFAVLQCALAHPAASSDPITNGLQLLKSVAGQANVRGATAGDQTQWSVVYDFSAGTVSVSTPAAPAVKFFSLNNIDFACSSPTQVLNINDTSLGNVQSKFQTYVDNPNIPFITKGDSTAHCLD